jgi:hypothetical protein
MLQELRINDKIDLTDIEEYYAEIANGAVAFATEHPEAALVFAKEVAANLPGPLRNQLKKSNALAAEAFRTPGSVSKIAFPTFTLFFFTCLMKWLNKAAIPYIDFTKSNASQFLYTNGSVVYYTCDMVVAVEE